MSIWDWIRSYQIRAMVNRNEAGLKLVKLVVNALEFMDTDPDQMIGMLDEAEALAETLNEPWWKLTCAHWKLQALLFRKQDLTAALKLAVKATVEARKPIYEQFPQRLCLHEDLIKAYAGADPDGYAPVIKKAMVYMTEEVTPEMECWHCLHGLRGSFMRGQEKWAEALELELRYLSISDNDHHQALAYSHLCEIAFEQDDWESLTKWAEAGEQSARQGERTYVLVELLMWQALAARNRTDEQNAQRFYQLALAQVSRLASIPDRTYYKALTAYHETGNDLPLALDLRRQELETLTGKGQTIAEYYCRREICRLLAKMGQPLAVEIANAQKAARQLKNPEKYLAALTKIKGVT